MQRASSALLQQVDMEETKPAPSRLRRAATSPAVRPGSAVLARRENDVEQISVSPQQRVSSRAAADFGLGHGARKAAASPRPARWTVAALRCRPSASKMFLDVTCHLQLKLLIQAC